MGETRHDRVSLGKAWCGSACALALERIVIICTAEFIIHFTSMRSSFWKQGMRPHLELDGIPRLYSGISYFVSSRVHIIQNGDYAYIYIHIRVYLRARIYMLIRKLNGRNPILRQLHFLKTNLRKIKPCLSLTS